MPPANFIDLTGQTFGRWTIIRRAENKLGITNAMWLAQCACGVERIVNGNSLKSGKSKSCGCLTREKTVERLTKHGYIKNESFRREYTSWIVMKQRCLNKNNPNYPNYGGRGIKVCDRWLNDFKNFIFDLGPRPKGASLERINYNGNYEPGNVRWANRIEQARNTRRNHLLTMSDGRCKTMAEWAEISGLPYYVIQSRINRNGWNVDQAINTPLTENTKLLTTSWGETKTITQWAKELETHQSTIRQRIENLGWSIDRAVTTPIKKRDL